MQLGVQSRDTTLGVSGISKLGLREGNGAKDWGGGWGSRELQGVETQPSCLRWLLVSYQNCPDIIGWRYAYRV